MNGLSFQTEYSVQSEEAHLKMGPFGNLVERLDPLIM